MIPPDRKIKVCLVGAGVWGRQHARVFSQRPDVQLRAVAGRNLPKTQARAAEFGLRAYTNVEEMAQAEKRGLFFAINFNHRYAKPLRLAREAIKAGRLGDITHATWRFGGEANVSPHPHANLIETQCHGFDQLEDLCGPITSVMAEMTDRTGGGYRTVALALRFANGAVGSTTGTYDSSYAYQDTHRLEINGTRGRVVVEDTVRRFSFQERGSETAEIWQGGYFNDFDREFHRTFDTHLDAVLDAFKRGSPPPGACQYRPARTATCLGGDRIIRIRKKNSDPGRRSALEYQDINVFCVDSTLVLTNLEAARPLSGERIPHGRARGTAKCACRRI